MASIPYNFVPLTSKGFLPVNVDEKGARITGLPGVSWKMHLLQWRWSR